MSKRCVGVRIVRVSFNLDYAVIENRLAFNVQDICHFRYFVQQNPMTLKIQRRSEFLPRCFIVFFMNIFDCRFCVKNYVFCRFYLFIQYEHLVCRLLLGSLTVILSPRKSSNRPSWSIMRIVRFVMLRAIIGKWMICADVSDILYPSSTFGKFMYRVYVLVVAVCTVGYIALNVDNVYVDDIYWYVRFVPLFQYMFRWESQLSNVWWNLSNKHT